MNQLIQNKLPFAFLKIGRWWGNNALAKREEEIDILAYDSQKAIFGEYTWSDNEVGLSVYDDLLAQSALFNFTENYFYLIAKTTFSKSCQEVAKESDHLRLVTVKEMSE